MQDWYEFYGLDRDPFAEGGMYGLFYPGGGRQELVEQLQHLARFSDCTLLVYGGAGAGKTALRRHLTALSAPDTRCCVIEASLLEGPERLLGRILEGFGIDADAQRTLDDGLQRVAAFTAARHAESLHSWLLIDDAQHLHADALALLPRLLQQAGAGLRLILFAEPQWQSILQAALSDAAPVHALELAPFDRAANYAYLHYRLKTAGLEAEPPFNAGEFEEIHRQSGGMPGRVDVLARKVLTDAVIEVEQPLSTLPLWHFGVVAATLLALLLFYMWGSPGADHGAGPVPHPGVAARDAAWQTETLVIEPENEAEVIREPALRDSTGQEVPENAAPVPVPDESASGLALSSNDAITEPRPDIPAMPVAGLTVPPASVAPENAAGSRLADPPFGSTPALSDSPAPRDSRSRGGTPLSADEEYLLGLDGAHFVVQVMSADDAGKVEAFARRQSLPLRRFRKLHNGQEWYALVHGDFADRAAAERALRELPEGLRAGSPWLRRAGAVQGEIRAAAMPR